MVISENAGINFKKKIVIILMCLFLMGGSIESTKVEASATAGAITMAMVVAQGAAAVGAAAVTFAPYVAAAVAIVGTGVIVYENADEIISVAQYLYNESSIIMRNLIEAAYDAGSNVLIMTDAIRSFILRKALDIKDMLSTPDATLQSVTIDPSYERLPALFSVVELDDIREPHIYSNYNEYLSFALGTKIYYITGLRDIGDTSISGEAIIDIPNSSGYINFEGVNNMRAEKSQTSPTVYIDVFEYDTLTNKYTKHVNSTGVTFDDGLRISISRTTPTNNRTSTVRSITVSGVENVLDLEHVNSSEAFNDLLIGGGFVLTEKTRVFLDDYTPGKTVSVNVGDMVINPGLTEEEMEESLAVAFPTNSGAIHLDKDKDITGIGAKEVPDVLIDSGVVSVPKTITGVTTGELDKAKSDIDTAIESALPSIFPLAQNALVGLENVREEPPVIKINLNKIFDASVSEIDPDLDSPFEDGESTFFDFSDFNKYNFGGKPLIEYIRMIIGFGFIFSTFLYIWKKFTVSNS